MAIQMDKTMIIVSAVVGSLGLLGAILGFSAEGTKITLSKILVTEDGLCLYPENPALGLGVCAAIFLVIAQIIVAAAGGCCGCCKSRALPSESKRIIGVVCAVFSWITAIIAFSLYVSGAAWSANGSNSWPFCYAVKDGIFAGAAVLALVTTALGITSYVMLRSHPVSASASAAAATRGAPKADEEQQQPGGAGIAMGQPQFPPPPPPQGYSQAPPNYPQYSPPPQGYGQSPPNPQFAPPPAQGYAPNQYQQPYAPPPAAAQGYGAHPPPPAQGQDYGAPPTEPAIPSSSASAAAART